MLEELPLFSVVIPTYESSKTLDVPIKSLNAQTRKDLELIVVDDDSDDFEDVKALVENMCRIPYTLIRKQRRTSQVESRALGISRARGEFVCFLDHDDAWCPNKLEKLAEALHDHPDAGNSIFYHRLRCTYADGRAFDYPLRGIAAGEPVSEYLFLRNGMIQSSSMVFSKAVAERLQFDVTSAPHDDWDLVLRAGQTGVKFCYIDEVLAQWNVRRMAGRSNRDRSEVSLNWLKDRASLFTPQARSAFLVNIIVPKLAAEGSWAAALSLFCRELRNNPKISMLSMARLIERTSQKLLARSSKHRAQR